MTIKKNLKSDSGYALGLVLIFVMAVGTILGSVMMVTQLSADAQGRGVDQLTITNDTALASAAVLEQYAQEASAGYVMQLITSAPNCGFPTDIDGVKISCEVVAGIDSSVQKVTRVSFSRKDGKTIVRTFIVSADPVTGEQRAIEAN